MGDDMGYYFKLWGEVRMGRMWIVFVVIFYRVFLVVKFFVFVSYVIMILRFIFWFRWIFVFDFVGESIVKFIDGFVLENFLINFWIFFVYGDIWIYWKLGVVVFDGVIYRIDVIV